MVPTSRPRFWLSASSDPLKAMAGLLGRLAQPMCSLQEADPLLPSAPGTALVLELPLQPWLPLTRGPGASGCVGCEQTLRRSTCAGIHQKKGFLPWLCFPRTGPQDRGLRGASWAGSAHMHGRSVGQEQGPVLRTAALVWRKGATRFVRSRAV